MLIRAVKIGLFIARLKYFDSWDLVVKLRRKWPSKRIDTLVTGFRNVKVLARERKEGKRAQSAQPC